MDGNPSILKKTYRQLCTELDKPALLNIYNPSWRTKFKMCFFSKPSPPPKPDPLPPPPPAPPAPTPPPLPDVLPDAEKKPVNPMVKQAQSKLGIKKGKKGSTADLKIKLDQAASGASASINPGNPSTTGGIQ